MRRRAFAGALTTLLTSARAVCARPAAARQQTPVRTLVERIPGITGVYARTLDGKPPLVAINVDQQFASASVIKLAIMLTAFRAYEARRMTPDTLVSVQAHDIIGGSDVLSAAVPGDRYSMRTLVDAMIRQSDNTAANTLITTLRIGQINATMRHVGMTRTLLARHFADVVPPGQRNLNTTTPLDIGTLLYQIERGAHEGIPTVASAVSCRAMIEIMLGQEYRNMIPAGIHRKVQIANKTGELDNVRNDAAIVDPFGEAPYVLVVLTRDLEDTDVGIHWIRAIAGRIDQLLG